MLLSELVHMDDFHPEACDISQGLAQAAAPTGRECRGAERAAHWKHGRETESQEVQG